MTVWSHLPVDQLGMLKNGNDVTNDGNAEVHHDIFTEVHQHILVNSAMLIKTDIKTWTNWSPTYSKWNIYTLIQQLRAAAQRLTFWTSFYRVRGKMPDFNLWCMFYTAVVEIYLLKAMESGILLSFFPLGEQNVLNFLNQKYENAGHVLGTFHEMLQTVVRDWVLVKGITDW